MDSLVNRGAAVADSTAPGMFRSDRSTTPKILKSYLLMMTLDFCRTAPTRFRTNDNAAGARW